MEPAPQEVCDSWWMANYSFSKQEQPAWLFLGLQLGLLMSDMKWCLWAGRPWAVVKLILYNPVKSEEVVSEKCALSSSVASQEMIPAVLPLVKTGGALKHSQNIRANCFHVLGKMQVFSTWSVCAFMSVMVATCPFQWMLLADQESFKTNIAFLVLASTKCAEDQRRNKGHRHTAEFLSLSWVTATQG